MKFNPVGTYSQLRITSR